MNDDWQQWGKLLEIALTAGFFGWLFYAFFRRKSKPRLEEVDEPDGTPYRVFDTDTDLIIRARDVVSRLRLVSPDRAKGWMLTNPALWRTWVDRADALYAASNIALESHDEVAWNEWAVCLLVDQSGSMKGEPMARSAAAIRKVSETLRSAGCEVAVLGFSTVGWHGGNVAGRWRSYGSPKRPGRLCSLLHVEYQSFDEPMSRDDWEAMLHPDILRENVDGEALEWASSELLCATRPKKMLVVISDGAPVDDMTLMHNGPSYLYRHLMQVIARLQADERMTLAALGISYRVNEYYKTSEAALRLEDIPDRLLALVARASGDSEKR